MFARVLTRPTLQSRPTVCNFFYLINKRVAALEAADKADPNNLQTRRLTKIGASLVILSYCTRNQLQKKATDQAPF